MNPKAYVGAAIVVIVIIIGAITISGESIINNVTEGRTISSDETQQKILPVEVEIDEISVLTMSDKSANMKIKLTLFNPNNKSTIIQLVRYQIFDEDDNKITTGQIGERAGGMVTSSNYYTLLSNSPLTLSDEFIVLNNGDDEFWSTVSNQNFNWRITGEVYFNLSSMTSGEENIVSFDLTT